MLQATVDTLRQRISQSDRERVLEAQLLAAREESKSLHEDVDTAVASLRLEREKCIAMQQAVAGAEERALRAEARGRALEEELAQCRELLAEARGLFVHGAHIDEVIGRASASSAAPRSNSTARARPASASSYAAPHSDQTSEPAAAAGRTVLDARGHVVHAPAPADAMERDKQQRLEDARARAAARSADYRARQQRVSALHSEWRAGMPANVTTQTASLSARQHEDAQMPARDRRARYTPHNTTVLPARSRPARSPSAPPSRAFVAAARGSTGDIQDRVREEAQRALRRSSARARRTQSQEARAVNTETTVVSMPHGAPVPETPVSVHREHRALSQPQPAVITAPGNGTTGAGWGVPARTESVTVARPTVHVAMPGGRVAAQLAQHGGVGRAVSTPGKYERGREQDTGHGLMGQMIAEARQRGSEPQ